MLTTAIFAAKDFLLSLTILLCAVMKTMFFSSNRDTLQHNVIRVECDAVLQLPTNAAVNVNSLTSSIEMNTEKKTASG
jgi:hypothetical protein